MRIISSTNRATYTSLYARVHASLDLQVDALLLLVIVRGTFGGSLDNLSINFGGPLISKGNSRLLQRTESQGAKCRITLLALDYVEPSRTIVAAKSICNCRTFSGSLYRPL